MVIGQQVFADIVKGTYGSLADLFKTEGSMYGDTKLFYSVQLGHVEDWANDAEASNLLALNRPADPYCQAITIDQFKKIWLTVDNFLSKASFGNEGIFTQFNSVILGTLRDTKRVYEAKLMNVAVGTMETDTGKQSELQKYNAQEIIKSGGEYILLRPKEFDEFKELINKYE